MRPLRALAEALAEALVKALAKVFCQRPIRFSMGPEVFGPGPSLWGSARGWCLTCLPTTIKIVALQGLYKALKGLMAVSHLFPGQGGSRGGPGSIPSPPHPPLFPKTPQNPWKSLENLS